MNAPYGAARQARIMDPDERLLVTVQKSCLRSSIMKWETPEAIDMRFGMEITMYISNR
jgi:coenzyme PQQ precursor peptide PqqA